MSSGGLSTLRLCAPNSASCIGELRAMVDQLESTTPPEGLHHATHSRRRRDELAAVRTQSTSRRAESGQRMPIGRWRPHGSCCVARSGTPGQILADEVGMGKTFVALAVAVSVLESTDYAEPVVVMVPPSVRPSGPANGRSFARSVYAQVARSEPRPRLFAAGPSFSTDRRRPTPDGYHIIFLTHGALTSTLTDPLIRLAIVQQHSGGPACEHRGRCSPGGRPASFGEPLNEALVRRPPQRQTERWMKVCNAKGWEQNDDPVPGGRSRHYPRST